MTLLQSNSEGCLGTGVATMSTLRSQAQLHVQDTEKPKQCRCNDVRLTESRNTRSEQLLLMHVMPTELSTCGLKWDWEWLPGSYPVDRNIQRPCWLLEMKYQTCFACSYTRPWNVLHYMMPWSVSYYRRLWYIRTTGQENTLHTTVAIAQAHSYFVRIFIHHSFLTYLVIIP